MNVTWGEAKTLLLINIVRQSSNNILLVLSLQCECCIHNYNLQFHSYSAIFMWTCFLLTFIFCNTHLDWFLTNIHFCEWCTHYLAQCFHSYHNHNVHPKQLFYTSTTVCSYSHTRHSYSITIDAITHSYLQPKFKPFLNNVFIHVNHVGLNKISTFTTLFKLCINFHWMKVL